MFHALFVGFVALAFLYLMCFSLVFAFFSIRAGAPWPFQKDYYSDLQDLPYKQILFWSASLFLLALALYLALPHPWLLLLLFCLAAFSLLLYRLIGGHPGGNPPPPNS